MYDVIVIGAGPCGNMAALELAERGISVAVLDKRTNIGDKLCTGIIGRECAELFPPAPEHIHGEARSATIVSPGGRRYRIERKQTHAYIVNRVAYVNSVAERAQQVGAEYTLNTRVTDIRITDAHAEIDVIREDGRHTYHCRVVILASGFGSPLLRMAGINAGKHDEYLVGYQVEADATDLSETEVYLGSDTAQNSFAWLVPLSEGRALVGMAPRRRANGQMEGFIERLKSDGKIDSIASNRKHGGSQYAHYRRATGIGCWWQETLQGWSSRRPAAASTMPFFRDGSLPNQRITQSQAVSVQPTTCAVTSGTGRLCSAGSYGSATTRACYSRR